MVQFILSLIKRVFKGSVKKFDPACEIVPRNDHCVSRTDISDNALKVLKRLNKAGFEAHLVGGAVRDLLLRKSPKDFDVATNATPEEVKKLFKNCRLIGRRFRLAHVFFGRDIVEVATFRSSDSGTVKGKKVAGMIMRDNQYGTLAEDAYRRDFTVNAFYWNCADFSVVDYHQGMADLHNCKIRMIGNPSERYEEDPVRMLRAIRFAAKLDFEIDEGTGTPIKQMGERLTQVSSSRLFEEFIKLFQGGQAKKVFHLLQAYDLLQFLFPELLESIAQNQEIEIFIEHCLESTDKRIAIGKPVTPAFLFAGFMWPLVLLKLEVNIKAGLNPHHAFESSARDILGAQKQVISIPKRFILVIKEIWRLQSRLERRHFEKSRRLLGHPRFRAAYDFLVIRSKVGQVEAELADWWTDLQAVDESEQEKMLQSFKHPKRRRRRRKT